MYKCLICQKNFQSKKRDEGIKKELLKQYVWQRQTYSNLADKFGRSEKWIQRKISEIEVRSVVRLNPQPLVVIADVTFFSCLKGLIVFRSPVLKKNVWWKFTPYERIDVYLLDRQCIEKAGFTLQAIVLDGKQGVRQAFSDIPVQMCHFHQKQIIKRYLTHKPKLEASIELKEITNTLTHTNQDAFTERLDNWHEKWKIFLKEKTANPETGRQSYKHKRLRAAYRSLKTNLPYLFTYQQYPELKIPNTTNSLDGFFNSLKSKLNVRRGLSTKRAKKVIIELLKGKD